jgi:hypothetical protein
MKLYLSVIAVLLFMAFGAAAQSTATKTKITPPDSIVNSPVKPGAKMKLKKGDWTKTWSVVVGFNSTFDSNLEHDVKPSRAIGIAPSVVAGYQVRSKHQRIRFIYGSAVSRYTRTTDLNRVGQYFGASYRLSFGRWSWETEGEAALKGATDDRETNNQFILSEKLGFRIDRKTRVNAYFSYRLKRYAPADADRNSVNPMFGFKFSRQFNKKLAADLGYRYDENRARSERQNYVRSTYDASLKYQLTKKDTIKNGISFRQRLYERTVRAGDVRLPRRDRKFSFDLAWQRQVNRSIGFEFGYGFEKQNSNDADKIYRNHLFGFRIFYHWGNGEIIEP